MNDNIEARMVCTGTDIFIEFGGLRIARRGYPGTPQAKTWVPLEPGFTVRDAKGRRELVIEFNGAVIQ
jgi:hypothetical protein